MNGEAQPSTDVGTHYLEESRRQLNAYKKLAEKAMAQVADADLFRAPAAEANSIAVIVQHICGNQRSRFTDLLTTDGEKPDRNRDGEFEPRVATRAELMALWEASWPVVFGSLASLQPGDLLRTVTIRGQPLTILQAILRQVAHYAHHIGQVVLLARQWKGEEWQSLSIPKGKSLSAEALAHEKKLH